MQILVAPRWGLIFPVWSLKIAVPVMFLIMESTKINIFFFFSKDNFLILFTVARSKVFLGILFDLVICWLPSRSPSFPFSLCSLILYSPSFFSIPFRSKWWLNFKSLLFWVSVVSIAFCVFSISSLNSWYSIWHERNLSFNSFDYCSPLFPRNHYFLSDGVFFIKLWSNG